MKISIIEIFKLFHEIKIQARLQKVKELFEKMDAHMKCYRHYIEHVPAPSFDEWPINMGINNDTSEILYASNSINNSDSNMPVNFKQGRKGKK